MKIGFVLFTNYFQRKGIGSSRIRGEWVIKYLNRIKGVEAECFVQGKEYDVILFQKAYWKEMARNFDGLKILDICDPDWLDGAEVVSFAKEMDLITVPTEKLKEALEQYTDKPVYVIPDSEDLEILPPPKKHIGKAKMVLWFGYGHNVEVLYPTFFKIKKSGLILKIVSDANLNTSECSVKNVKWNEETCDKEYQEADFVLLPEKLSGRHIYKSNNKTIHSKALGLPVAKTAEQMELYMDGEERQKASIEGYNEVKENYSTENSANLLYKLIKKYDGRKN